MTGTKIKVRSLFLTALMIVSVFGGTMALAGSAAAAGNISHSLSDNNEGATGVTYTHNISASGTLNRVVADLDNPDSTPNHDLSAVTLSDITVLVDGEEYTGTYSSFSRDSASGEVRFTLDSPQTVSSSVEVIVGDVGNPTVDSNTDYTQQTRLYSDTDGTVMDDPHAAATYTIEDVTTDGGEEDVLERGDGDAAYVNDTNRWQGQRLFFEGNDGSGDSDSTYGLYEVNRVGGLPSQGTLVTEVGLDQNGRTLISTSNLEGEYVLEDEDGNIVRTNESGVQTGDGDGSVDEDDIVTIVEQDFSASFNSNAAGQGGPVSFDTDSNRANYQVTVSSDGMSDSTLEATFGDADTDRDGVQVQVDSNQDTISGDLPSDAETGNHSVSFDVVDTDNSDSDYLEVSQAGPNAEFSQSVYTEMRGDPVTITVDLQNANSANLRLGSEDVNYNTTLQVNDGDGDGQVTFDWNTWEAGRHTDEGAAFTAISEGDSVSDVQRFSNAIPSGERLAAADYDLTASVGDTETDVSVVSVRERSTDGASQYTGPDITNTTVLFDTMSESDEVAWQDRAVTRVTASGLYGYIQDGGDMGTNGVNMSAVQSGDQINQSPKEISLDSDDFVVSETTNRVYLIVDTDQATATRGSESGLALQPGETYTVTFEIDGDYNPYVPAGETEEVSTEFTIVDRTAEFDVNADDEIIVEPAADQTISGTTSVAPGTEMSIRAKATGTSPFLKTDSVTVQDDGSFAGTFDFSNVSENTTFTATVPNEGFSNDAATQGRVGQPRSASVSISDQASDGSTVTVNSVTVSHGGFVTIHDSSLQDGDTFESVRGTSDYLSAGSHSSVEVSLDEPYSDDGTVIAMPHQDTNDNQAYDFVSSDGAEDGPYTEDGEAVTDSAELTIETPTPTPDDTPTESEEPPDTDTDTDEPTDSPTDEEQPGFGLIVALVALAGAALLALRRD